MKKSLLTAAAVLAISAGAASAADLGAKMYTKAPPPPPAPVWDIAFGGAIASDYNFRGISQSDKGPSASAYFEPRFNLNPNLQLYAGIAGASVKLPTDPAAEIDFYAGIRPTFGALSFDLGVIYYYYPKEQQLFSAAGVLGTPLFTTPTAFPFTLGNTDYYEVYGKVSYAFNDSFSVGANVFYSPSWLNTGADGTYGSLTAKYTAPAGLLGSDLGMYVSGEVGHYWLGTGTNGVAAGVIFPDYNTWNVGVGFTWKVFTLDLRYYDTDMNKATCFAVGGDPKGFTNGTAQSNWCDATFIAKLSFDLTAATNLK